MNELREEARCNAEPGGQLIGLLQERLAFPFLLTNDSCHRVVVFLRNGAQRDVLMILLIRLAVDVLYGGHHANVLHERVPSRIERHVFVAGREEICIEYVDRLDAESPFLSAIGVYIIVLRTL